MIPEWINQGLIPVIVTYDICGDWDIDVPVYKIPQNKTSKIVKVVSHVTGFFENRYYKEIFKYCERLIKEHEINLVFSFSNPQDSNIIGAMLKEGLGVKFVSHFSDPYFNSPYKSFPFWRRRKVFKSEKYILEQSDSIVFVSEALKNYVLQNHHSYTKDKAVVIPHCFDRKLYPQGLDLHRSDNIYVMSHIGAFYKKRNPETLFRALNMIKRKNPKLLNNFRLKLIGATSDYAGYSESELKALIKQYCLDEIIESIPPVDYNASLRIMVESDCLLVIDADITDSPFLPSKLIDYIGSGKNIIGITPVSSPTHDIIKKLGCRSFSYGQIAELADYIKKMLISPKKPVMDQIFADGFDVKNTTNKLIEQFQYIVGNS